MDAMTCERFEAEVSGYVDDDVTPEVRAVMDAHRASCSGCADLAVEVRRVSVEARELPLLAPSRDLWPGIEARIEAPVIPLADAQRNSVVVRRAGRRWHVAPHWLAAAALALVVVSSVVTYVFTTVGPSAPSGGETGPWVIAGTGRSLAATPVTAPASETYDDEIRTLRAIVDSRRSQLDPATVATIERSLRVIDDAIAESRQALERDPANAFLYEQLDRTLARKVEMLRALALAPRS